MDSVYKIHNKIGMETVPNDTRDSSQKLLITQH